jgi:hypothetical protein
MINSDFFNELDESYKEIFIQSKAPRLDNITIQKQIEEEKQIKPSLPTQLPNRHTTSNHKRIAEDDYLEEDLSDVTENYKVMALHYKSLCKVFNHFEIILKFSIIKFY